MPEKLHLVYATDKGFLMPTMVSAASAIAHASEPERLVIDILDCGFDDADWQNLTRALIRVGASELHRYSMDMSRYAKYKAYRGNLGVYARLDIPELIKGANWCVYVDGDTLFLANPLDLVKYCDDKMVLLGHKDLGGSEEQLSWYARNKLTWNPDDYVCAGFILMNLKWMRDNKISQRSFEFLVTHPDTPLNDQDVLNIFCQDHKALLPPEWGVFNVESFENRLIPKCVHYAYGKPWRLDADWTRCLLDVDRLWFTAAKKYCGISIADCVPVSHYFRRWIRSLVHRIFLLFVCTTEYGRKRWGKQRCYYSSKSIKNLL